VLRGDDPWPAVHGRPCVDRESSGPHPAAIARERERARSAYGLLVVPGLELTYNDPDPDLACHAVAVGLERLLSMGEGPGGAWSCPAWSCRTTPPIPTWPVTPSRSASNGSSRWTRARRPPWRLLET